MKKIILVALCAALIVISATGCVVVGFAGANTVVGTGERERFEFKTGEITEIRLEMYCNVDYYSAPSDTVTLDIQPNLMEYVTVEENNGVLTVRCSRGISWSGNNASLLTVSSPALKVVHIAGANTFTAHDKITADAFTFKLSGAGTATAELDVESLTIDMSGAGTINFSGRAETAKLILSGAGTLNALSLQTRDADINLNGAGTVSISCSDNLKINANGAGSVEYRGSPSTDISRNGVVSIRQVN